MASPAPATTEASSLYGKLEERILDRDQRGTSDVFYDLVRAGRPLAEMLGETVRIHAPYTHVPYHQRIDNGVVRFVNNDHCLLSARASLRMARFVGEQYRYLPLAQTMWYVPTGLDPWNQLLGKMPGHYARTRFERTPDLKLPPPSVHWEDQEPLIADGTLDERLNDWLNLVQRGQVDQAYRTFLGLLEDDGGDRERVLGQLAFAGLIDVQDRMLYNRSYTTGHKSYRARPPSNSATPWAGKTRTRSSTPVCRTLPWGRAGTRTTRWPAKSPGACWPRTTSASAPRLRPRPSSHRSAGCSPTRRRSRPPRRTCS